MEVIDIFRMKSQNAIKLERVCDELIDCLHISDLDKKTKIILQCIRIILGEKDYKEWIEEQWEDGLSFSESSD